MSSTSQALKRLGVGTVSVATLLATPYLGVGMASAAPATIAIASQTTNTGSTRNDGTNTTVKISATVTPNTAPDANVASVRFSYQVGAATPVVIGSDTTAPYSIEWAPPAAGTYKEIAEALDSAGNVIAQANNPAVVVAAVAAVHITSPVDGGQIGSFGGNVTVKGTRSSDLPALSITAQTRNNDTGVLTAAGAASTVAQGVPAAGADQSFAVSVAAPACPSGPAPAAGCDVVITAVASGTGGATDTSDEVVESKLYSQTVKTFSVAPTSVSKPTTAVQTFVATALDQNGQPVAGVAVTEAKNAASAASTATSSPASGPTTTAGTFSFTASDAVAEATTFTVRTNFAGGVYNPAVDFSQDVTLTTYAAKATTVTLVATPSKPLYAAQSEYTSSTPVVDVCIVDQNGQPVPNAVAPPANMIATVTRTETPATTPASITSPATATQDTSGPTKANCYILSHNAASGNYGTDVYNVYFENNGTPGYQPGSTDVTAAPLTLKYATLVINAVNTQVQKGSNGTASFTVVGADGTPFANRKVSLAITSGSTGVFPTTPQPGSTVRTSAASATCTTDAAGVCAVTVADPNAETITVTATDGPTDATTGQITTGVNTGATVDFRTLPVTLTTAYKSSPYALYPSGPRYDTRGVPGVPIVDTYTLTDANGGALANVPVTLTADHGFFTPLPKVSTDYTTLSFTPAIADGGQAGNLVSLTNTITRTTDNSGNVTVALANGRDAAFDATGSVIAKVTFAATGGTYVLNNPADANQPGTDFNATWTTDATSAVYNPLNGASVAMVPATAVDVLSGNVQLPNGTNFVVQAKDQFGNLTRPNGCPITLGATGFGRLSSTTSCGSFTTAPTVVTLDSSNTASNYAGDSSTVTATWPNAPVTTFKGASPATTPQTYTINTTTASKTSSFTVNLYAIDLTHLAYTFASTPGNSVPVNTGVTTSVTVKDQKGNPVGDLCVKFLRSGPGNQSADAGTGPFGNCTIFTGTTGSAAGKAGYSYSSTAPGTATVTVIVSDASGNELSRGVQKVEFTTPTSAGSVPQVSVSVGTITAGQGDAVTVVGTPGQSIELLAASAPSSTFVLAQVGTLDASGQKVFVISPKTNTRIFARSAAGSGTVKPINVRTAVSLAASATGKVAHFSGRVFPNRPGQIVTLFYRKGAQSVVVGKAKVNGSGAYSFTRSFAKGAVTFYAATGTDAINVTGKSPDRRLTFK